MGHFNPNLEFSTAKEKSNHFSSDYGGKETLKNPKKCGLKSITTKEMSQCIWLFNKYLLTRAQNNIGRTSQEESEMIQKLPSHALSVPSPKYDPRLHSQASLLEQRFLPQIMCDGVASSSMAEDRSSTGQLTIFYGGAINVYNNIPIDKAQAIMLLAGESSLSNTAAIEFPTNIDTEAAPHQSRILKTGLPMPRRYSLQCFLQKRRERIFNKSPYASSCSKKNGGMIMNGELGPYQNDSVSLPPFPSQPP